MPALHLQMGYGCRRRATDQAASQPCLAGAMGRFPVAMPPPVPGVTFSAPRLQRRPAMTGRQSPTFAKLTRPRLRDAVPRPRLFAELDAARKAPVVWVDGPPGAGKTTLVSTYIEARGLPFLWYQVDPGDVDPASLFYFLRLAAKRFSRRAQHLPVLSPEYGADVPSFARRFFRMLFATLPPGTVLVFDDYQEVPGTALLHRIVEIATEQLPESLSIIGISREPLPPSLVRAAATERVARVGWTSLRLTAEESIRIAERNAVFDTALATRAHEEADGWAAGLTLMITQPVPEDIALPTPRHRGQQSVFDYFASVVLDRLSSADQQALVKTSLLPRFTIGMAQAITKHSRIAMLLQALSDRNLFVYRVGARDSEYVYHALFRRFLGNRARSTLPAKRYANLRQQAAEMLQEAGFVSDAIDVHVESKDWSAAIPLILETAPALLANGRWQTLLASLARLPESLSTQSAELLYWRGKALSQVDPPRARVDLNNAAKLFATAGNTTREMLALADAMGTVVSDSSSQTQWIPALSALDRLIPTVGAWPSASVELTVRSAHLLAAAHVQPRHPVILPLTSVIFDLMRLEEIDVNERAAAGVWLLIHVINRSELKMVRRLMDRLGQLAGAEELSVLNRCLILTFRGLAHYGMFLEFAEAQRLFAESRRLAIENGVPALEPQIDQFEAEIYTYHDRDRAASRAKLAQIEHSLQPSDTLTPVFFHCTSAHAAGWDGDPRRAVRHAQACLQAAESSSEAFYLFFGRWLIHTFVDAGDVGRARRLLDDLGSRLAGTCYESCSIGLMLMQEAYLCRAEECADRYRDCLTSALSRAREDDRQTPALYWMGKPLAVLLGDAIALDIETAFVRDLIQRLDMPAPDNAPLNWPWPVRAVTLGGFELSLRGEPLRFGRKVPRKILALFKVLVCFGGRDVPESKVLDALWPDEEGDTAHGNCTMAVVRLRRLLGDARCVIQQGGMLSLDLRRCHVDALAFDRLTADGTGDEDDVYNAIRSYGGQFLPQDDEVPWTRPLRERLHRRYLHALCRLASQLEQSERHSDALSLYQRGLGIDESSAALHEGVVRCLEALGRTTDVIAAKEQLRGLLSASAAASPDLLTGRTGPTR